MRIWIAVVAALAFESAAIACSCMATDDPVRLRELAANAAQGAVAIVEAETLSEFHPGGPGERLAVRRVLAGHAPQRIQIERGPMASGASCDDLFSLGQRKLVILYRTPASTYHVSNLCISLLLDKPVFRGAVTDVIDGKARGPERG